MNIKIVVGSYFPKIHPRAFRATELAKEFTRLGHQVTVICMSSVEGFDYEAYTRETGIKIIHLNIFSGDHTAKVIASKSTGTRIGKLKRFCIEYFLCGNLFKYGSQIAKSLDGLDGADMVIALSTPFPVHYGYAKYIKKNGRNFVSILDSGDPFYYSRQTKRAIWFKGIEKSVYKECDYLTIPTENAIPLYSPLIDKDKIKIIPQGFNMRDLKLYNGTFKGPVRIAYAGVFYWDIRNPEFLFRYLDTCGVEYDFYLYMRFKDAQFDAAMERYPNFAKRVKVSYGVPHNDLIYKLSEMDFLINIENVSNTQMPSKLIDYGMTNRPIFSCKESTFSTKKMERFLSRDYTDSYKVDIANYNIEKIAQQFLELYKSVSR